MKSLRLKIGVVMAILVSLFSCTKDDDSPRENNDTPLKKVKKVTSTPNDYVVYEYNSRGNIEKFVSNWKDANGNVNTQTNVYQYQGDKLVKVTNDIGFSEFMYTNNTLLKSEHYVANGRKLSTLLYTFENGKLKEILEQVENPLPDGIEETKITYEYRNDGNVKRTDFAYRKAAGDPFTHYFSKVFLEYDNKENTEPDGIIGFFIPSVVLHKNNPLLVNNLAANGSVEGILRYEYTYNDKGLPVERKQFITTNGVEALPISFQYAY